MSAKHIIPTVLEYTKVDFINWTKQLNPFFKTVHIDIVDSSYGKQTWFDEIETFDVVRDFENLIVHVMVSDPIVFLTSKLNYLRKNNTRYLISGSKINNLSDLSKLKESGLSFGVFFELGDVVTVTQEHFEYFNEFMFMPIHAGSSNNPVDLSMLETLDYFVDTHFDKINSIVVSTDGGFNEANIGQFIKAPANIYYANTYFKKLGIQQAITKFKEELKN